jgi:diguanylate cyclase (GGDEF)-like protein
MQAGDGTPADMKGEFVRGAPYARSSGPVEAALFPRRGLLLELLATEAPPAGLVAYALVLVAVALVAMVAVVATFPVLPTIAIGGMQPAALGMFLGVAFWIAFGFVGSVRPQRGPGGAVVTFHMPFVIAGTVLGGPVVGALMGVISLTELREIRRAPWYGVLANHAICVLAAVMSGVAGELVSTWLGQRVPADDPTRTLIVGLVVAGTFLASNLLLVLPVIAVRTGSEFISALRRASGTLRATLVAEVALGWLMAITFLSVAWWAPIVSVLVILAVWDAHDRREALLRDPMTGLLNDAGASPLLDLALAEARRGAGCHALLFIDLDGFGQLNKSLGEDVGDDVLVAVGRRIQAAVRSTDVVSRQHRAGDEFMVLLRDLAAADVAVRLAWRLHAAILEPVHVRGASMTVSVGASIGIAMLEPGTTASLDDLKRLADTRMQQVKRARGGVLGPDRPS